MPAEVFNPNPIIFTPTKGIVRESELLAQSLWIDEPISSEDETGAPELIDTDEIFDLIRSIYDPEHPNTLEELRVVSAPQIKIEQNRVTVEFTPTVPHCGMSTLIGLCIRVRLLRSLPTRFKVDLFVKPGSHQSEHAGMPLDVELYCSGPHGSLVNKQLNDKERVAAALENPILLETVEQCLRDAGRRGLPLI